MVEHGTGDAPASGVLIRRLLLTGLAAPLVWFGAPRLGAQSGGDGGPFFTRRDLIGAAVVTAATVALLPVEDGIADRMRRHRIADSLAGRTGLRNVVEHLANINEYRLFYFSAATWGVGRLTRQRRVADVGWHAAEAILGSRIVVDLIAGPAGRARPKTNPDPMDFKWWRGFTTVGYHSFPSRHTAAVFALAAVLTEETRQSSPRQTKWVAPVTYGVATAVGLGRMYTDHHWTTDIVTAAAIGVFSGVKAVNFSHAHPNNSIDRLMLGRARDPDGRASLILGVQRRF